AFLYTMNADGSRPRFLFEASDMCCPDFSPDGRRIALSVNGEIYVVNTDGRGRRLVSGAGFNTSPSWSPDGRRIVFDSDRDEDDWEIFVVPAGGGPALQLTDNEVDDEWPDWSPDGKLVAFSRGDLSELEGSLYVMATDGSRQRRVPLQVPAAMPSWQPLR
ncbi:MAG: TolB family protein, partial [Gaiellaceae bacterium]